MTTINTIWLGQRSDDTGSDTLLVDPNMGNRDVKDFAMELGTLFWAHAPSGGLDTLVNHVAFALNIDAHFLHEAVDEWAEMQYNKFQEAKNE